MKTAELLIKDFLKKQGVENLILEIPPDSDMGDFAFPCFELAKDFKKKPNEISSELMKKFIPDEYVSEARVVGPYLNFFINRAKSSEEILTEIFKDKDNFGNDSSGKNKTIVIDYSHPNIAKPFGIGHLRSTVIGNALKNIYTALGYKVVGVNHLGDWGTQFGKLIVAFRAWGDEKELEKNPIVHLLSVYVKFHEEAEKRPELNDQAREEFKKLELGDKDAFTLWELFRELSLTEFKKFYKQLDVEFDSYDGESSYIYNNKIEPTIKLIKENTETEISEGALVVNLGGKKPPLLLKKSDGASTYHTRDLAAAFHRIKEYQAYKLIYVVGSEQKLHFEQLFEVLERVGENPNMFEHVYFGLIKFPEGKMSTRKGNIIFLEEVLDKSIELALTTIKEKNPNLENKQQVAEEIGIGAIIFGDLINDRVKDINFSWDRILDFEGETAPYVQYTHARCCSILRKYDHEVDSKVNFDKLKEKEEYDLIIKLSNLNSIIVSACKNNKPHVIAKYLIDLSQSYNSFYVKCPVIGDDKELTKARILLVDSVRQVIKNGLALLGVKAPKAM